MLPIKISDNDKLPSSCCFNCFEILITAFKLRQTSLESDRYLRLNYEKDDSSPIQIKTEEEVEESNFFGVYEEIPQDNSPTSPDNNTQTFVSTLEYKQPPTTSVSELSSHDVYDIMEVFSEDLRVDFFKKKGRSKNASKVWEYFGRLINGNDEQVGSRDFHYCSLCLLSKKIVKYRTTSATTSLSNHLESVHGVMKDGEVIEPTRNDDFKQPKKRRFEGGGERVMNFRRNLMN